MKTFEEQVIDNENRIADRATMILCAFGHVIPLEFANSKVDWAVKLAMAIQKKAGEGQPAPRTSPGRIGWRNDGPDSGRPVLVRYRDPATIGIASYVGGVVGWVVNGGRPKWEVDGWMELEEAACWLDQIKQS